MPFLLRALALLALPLAAAAAEPDPEIRRVVVEDDQVRIEELRVRGQVQRITVHNKGSRAPDYQILPTEGGRDLSKDRGATGKRVWNLVSF